MTEMDVLTSAGETKGKGELPGSVFAVEGRKSLLWESVRLYLATLYAYLSIPARSHCHRKR